MTTSDEKLSTIGIAQRIGACPGIKGVEADVGLSDQASTSRKAG